MADPYFNFKIKFDKDLRFKSILEGSVLAHQKMFLTPLILDILVIWMFYGTERINLK